MKTENRKSSPSILKNLIVFLIFPFILLTSVACKATTTQPIPHSTNTIYKSQTPILKETLGTTLTPTLSQPTIKPLLTATKLFSPTPTSFLTTDAQYLSFGKIALIDGKDKGIRAINANGSDLRTLIELNFGYSVSWSPDGHWIAYTKRIEANDLNFYTYEGTTSQVWIMSADGKDQKQITNSNHSKFGLAWSPLGQEILYSTFPQGDIIAVQKDGEYLRKVTSLPGNELDPTWSPDGTKIAFLYNPDPQKLDPPYELRIINLSDGVPRLVTDFPINKGGIDWSSDGKYIVFSSFFPGPYQEYWSSTSGITRTLEPAPFRCGDLFTIKIDGTGLERLIGLPSCVKSPVWSPDGRYIAFLANANDKPIREYSDIDWEIFIFDHEDRLLTQLTKNVGGPDLQSIAWSHVPGLRIGQTYRLNPLGDNLVLRQEPSLKGIQIAQLKTGDNIYVLSAPVDSDNFYWRQVRLEDRTKGWIQEVGGWFTPTGED